MFRNRLRTFAVALLLTVVGLSPVGCGGGCGGGDSAEKGGGRGATAGENQKPVGGQSGGGESDTGAKPDTQMNPQSEDGDTMATPGLGGAGDSQ